MISVMENALSLRSFHATPPSRSNAFSRPTGQIKQSGYNWRAPHMSPSATSTSQHPVGIPSQQKKDTLGRHRARPSIHRGSCSPFGSRWRSRRSTCPVVDDCVSCARTARPAVGRGIDSGEQTAARTGSLGELSTPLRVPARTEKVRAPRRLRRNPMGTPGRRREDVGRGGHSRTRSRPSRGLCRTLLTSQTANADHSGVPHKVRAT
ncbi:hypothetical protein PYCCODRAFT_348949 [Trametes coccinea BRFM310]|uniref:Uncharacterized protein n=1 Tax=Trametes coccinea (strain BRFM310) TaxID=1353009 RepID=A0A1Y2J4N9_TRAC3|nr:hypothetical protein PYCCODRAFT_348949 [Trametes coccinea BRFM310]